jgi:hypothetical protein
MSADDSISNDGFLRAVLHSRPLPNCIQSIDQAIGDQLQKSKDDADAFAKLKAGTADVTLTLMPEAQVTCGNTNLLRGPLLVEPGGGEVVTHNRLDCARQMGSGDPKGSNAGQPSRNSFLCANRGGIDERIGDLLTGSCRNRWIVTVQDATQILCPPVCDFLRRNRSVAPQQTQRIRFLL